MDTTVLLQSMLVLIMGLMTKIIADNDREARQQRDELIKRMERLENALNSFIKETE